MKKLLFCLAMVSIASLALMPRLAHAQPDAGAKARGEFSVPFWSSRSSVRRISAAREYPSVAVQSAPVAVARVESGYRTFSYQPGAATTNYVIRRTTRATQPAYMNAGNKALGRY